MMLTLSPDLYFKALSDETRLRCMMLLYEKGQLCVCDLTCALALSQPKISRHLAQLRQIGLLLDKREGQWVYYQINPELPAWAMDILAATSQAVATQKTYQDDLQRLQSHQQGRENSCGAFF